VVGGLAGSEATMQIGWDVTVSAHAFDLYDYAALGHLHPQQRISDKAWYAGSPQYVSFGEINQQKGFLYVELGGSGVAPVLLDSAARSMISFDIADDSIPVAGIVDGVPEGAIVRLRLAETLASDYESRLITAVAGRASFVHKERIRSESAAPRARVEMAPEEGVVATTKRWLAVNGYPEEPYMTAAQEVLAEAAAE
jgi:DNA repair exonuclease SbcCD nuclease subunit